MFKFTWVLSTLLFILSHFAYAEVLRLNYKATFGIFGVVGTIENKIERDEKIYRIDTTVKLLGLAKILMGGQTERYISKGHIEDGFMVCDTYETKSVKKEKVIEKKYSINHKEKYVFKHYRKWINGTLVKDNKKRLSFYAKDDLLTLYFNLGHAIKEKGKKYIFNAVGLEKQKGKVQITVPSDMNNASYKKDLGGGAALYAKALIVQKNFRKKKGDILLAVAKDGFIQKSVIKDILLYGDAKLIRMD